jgi:hypothetical protein
MKPNLLDDVIQDGDYSAFRDELRARFIGEARRARRRRTTAWLAMAASIALLGFVVFFSRPHRNSAVVQGAKETVATIRTTTLKPEEMLATTTSVLVALDTRSFTASTFSTTRNVDVQSLTDADLLALFPEHPAGLIAAHGEKRFLFLDPADTKRFMSSN